MDVFEQTDFKLLHVAARFRPEPETTNRSVTAAEVVTLVGQLMDDGIYADEFASLDDPSLSYFEMLPILARFLQRLNWRPFDDRQEFMFLTAYCATMGRQDDVSAYYAMLRWMDDVGRGLQNNFTTNFVADGIGAENIYGCYYSYSNVTQDDLIQSVRNPHHHDWIAEGASRPKLIFADWLDAHPNALDEYSPIDLNLLDALKA